MSAVRESLSGRSLDIATAKAMGWTGQRAIDDDGLEYNAWTLRQSDGTLYMHGATLTTEAECWQYFPPHYSSSGDGLLAMTSWIEQSGLDLTLMYSGMDCEEAPCWAARLTGPECSESAAGDTPGEALARAITNGRPTCDKIGV